jgi:hypothetical protein
VNAKIALKAQNERFSFNKKDVVGSLSEITFAFHSGNLALKRTKPRHKMSGFER